MQRAVNLLVVEDNPADSDLIREHLSEIKEFKSNLYCVSTLEEAKKYLADNAVHAVLVDLSLPDSRGLQTLKEVVGYLKSATAIVLTSLDDKNLALDAIESGAQDYLVKGALDPELLSRVIRYSMQRSKWQVKLSEVQEQLNQSQKMESIGRLAGGVAHEFNNQLGSIGLLCELAQESLTADHPAREHVDQILHVSQKTAELTKRLMIFCRTHPAEPRGIDLNSILRNNERLFAKLMGVSINLQIQVSKPAPVLVDEGLMEQVLMNLAINARDAMPKSGRIIFKTSVRTAASGTPEAVILEVEDSGCGMSKEVQERIFEPFFTTKPIGKGTGLGLSMVYGTVRQFRGEIEVQSEVGVGTKFILKFPYFQSKTDETLKDKEETKKPDRGCVLIVDDEEFLRVLVKKILLKAGYEVLEARDGSEAIKIFDEHRGRIDLVLTDVVMPEMNGIELGRRIRALDPQMRILFSSGHSEGGAAETESISGPTDFLSKPASSQAILDKVRGLLKAGNQ